MEYTKNNILNRLSVAVAIMTFFGIALHDTKVDQLATVAVVIPVAAAAYEGAHLLGMLGGDSHTHVERVTAERIAARNTSSMPHLQARRDEDDSSKGNTKNRQGFHPFDDHTLPVFA